ncbi:MAG: CRISPR system precrRNA processing endoribonuclease RAMP protein Cas6 [Dehalococcoidales bacterium]|nr:CRISPR system precrRNA processing endoribonuclease RAMP protein Cas6 [Dehalococcoidales bacterium]
MAGLQAHILRFEAEATSDIHLRHHKGSALRGAFLHALRTDFCTNPSLASCHACSIHTSCPVCFLVSTIDEDGGRGSDAPRPYIIEPPVDARELYRPGDPLVFNIVLFSRALSMFPYVVIAAQRMGEFGLGIGRGRFALREVWAVEPVAGVQQRVLRRGDDLVKVPDLPIGHKQVFEVARHLECGASENLKVRFKTPLRLVTNGQLVHRLSFATLMRRLFERLTVLWDAYAGEPLALDFADVLACAEQIGVSYDNTRWLDLDRYSTRQGRPLPMGGLVGEIAFQGDLAPFLPWLQWGTITHVGKYAVMGNGWYELGQGTGNRE